MLKHLATGGMADVLLGRSDGIEGFERYVVLKRIRPEHAKDQQFIRMFLDEARVAATLHHQHIVQVHDIGESSGEYFIAMEYLHGEDVRTLLSNASRTRTHVALGFAVAIVSAVAGGLHYAHERQGNDKRPLNIVHRDVSPSNILVGYDGSIKIVDFGIAKASMREETRSGNLKGKLAYMSPEQCTGGEVDRRSDVYALGVVLYELATTSRMFKGENDYLVMEQIVKGRVTPPQVRRPNLPAELAEIIMRAVAPERDRRYATADDLRVAIDQFASRAGLIASSSTIAAYMRKKFGQRPEPWLDLPGPPDGSLDDVRTLIGEPMPSHSWTELPRSESNPPRSGSSNSMPLTSGPLHVITSEIAVEAAAAGSAVQPTAAARRSLAPPTGSKMGWESQQPATTPRRLLSQKIAIAIACGALIVGVGVWRLASSGSSPAPVVVVAPAAQPAPPPAPVVVAVAEPPRVPEPAASVVGSIATAPAPAAPAAPAVALQLPTRQPPTRNPRPAAAAAATRAATRLTVETTPPPSPRSASPPPAPATPPASTRSIEASAPVEDLRPVVAAAPPPPAPLPAAAPLVPATPAPPQAVTPSALDANRIAGDKRIAPDENTMAFISRSGTDQVVAAYKVCVTSEGTIGSVTLLKSTGFPAYDATIQSTIRSEWRYRPFLVAGKAAPVCTAYRFVYRQK
jgi:serine/threonine protein kinase